MPDLMNTELQAINGDLQLKIQDLKLKQANSKTGLSSTDKKLLQDTIKEREQKLQDTLIMAFEQTDTIMNEKFKEIKGTQPSFVELSGCTGTVLLV
mmetsp:Transcript_14729/g.22835  ORF Transcript_14729/g.22835 Transcript_14729/m.22835 type:complete len:96 (+) Transcript_14729:2446-2733(+)